MLATKMIVISKWIKMFTQYIRFFNYIFGEEEMIMNLKSRNSDTHTHKKNNNKQQHCKRISKVKNLVLDIIAKSWRNLY